MKQIETALSRRGKPARPTIHVDADALRATTQAREATAFTAGLYTGYITAATEAATVTVPVPNATPHPRRPLRSIVKAVSVLSVAFGLSGISAAYVWHTTDAQHQGEQIAMVRDMIQRGWQPIEGWETPQTSDNSYDRIRSRGNRDGE